MQVRVVYHDGVRDLVGNHVEMLHLDESATVSSLLSRLGASYPSLMGQLSSFQLSRSGMKITPDAFLADGDIIDVSVSESKTA